MHRQGFQAWHGLAYFACNIACNFSCNFVYSGLVRRIESEMTLCGGEDVVFLSIDGVKQGLGFIKEAKLY